LLSYPLLRTAKAGGVAVTKEAVAASTFAGTTTCPRSQARELLWRGWAACSWRHIRQLCRSHCTTGRRSKIRKQVRDTGRRRWRCLAQQAQIDIIEIKRTRIDRIVVQVKDPASVGEQATAIEYTTALLLEFIERSMSFNQLSGTVAKLWVSVHFERVL
jgi:hypothetical protein